MSETLSNTKPMNMIEAIRSIGRGADAFEGVPFVLDLR